MKKNSRYKIIIVEDDKNCIDLLSNFFKKYDCEVDSVNNEKEAVEKIIAKDYNFYFININIDGYDLIDLIKEVKEAYNIIIMVSDLSMETEKRVRPCGITYLLKKPFLEYELKELVEYQNNY